VNIIGLIRYEMKLAKRDWYGGKPPWEMTQDEFVELHKTGHLDPYSEKTVKDLKSWIRYERHPILVRKAKLKDGSKIELRRQGDELKYVKTDEEGEIVRDERGLAVYIDKDEMRRRGLPFKEKTITAFHNGNPIGWCGDSFGAMEVYVAKEYQKKGLGVLLMKTYMCMFRNSQICQMTELGEKASRRLHREFVKEALGKGKKIPQKVLVEYEQSFLTKMI